MAPEQLLPGLIGRPATRMASYELRTLYPIICLLVRQMSILSYARALNIQLVKKNYLKIHSSGFYGLGLYRPGKKKSKKLSTANS